MKIKSMEYEKAFEDMVKDFSNKTGYGRQDMVWFSNNSTTHEIEVHWSSTSNPTLDEALKLAKALELAVEMAKAFPYNGCKIDYSDQID